MEEERRILVSSYEGLLMLETWPFLFKGENFDPFH